MATLTVKAVRQYFYRALQRAAHKRTFMLSGLLMCLTGCTFFDNTIIKMPIALHQAGSVAEADFEIAQDDRVTLQLRFFVNDQPDDRKRLLAFLGGFGETKTSIPIKVRITKHISPKEDLAILEKTYPATKLAGYGAKELNRLIDDLTIKSGKYRIRLETIEEFPELSNTKVEFGMYYIRPPIM
ncbi:DUF5625 family protein [Methylobacter tundripaludum]|uniref:DUF5625 domain-containing protein n=1 Tax=Methylobacter tundripaludum (strain ATCC BAA-1195 / DSM 17260 / SV96) TaxID=697282 RepID=G3IQH4_METTV|nr:DUF5625 family protein [Methylobacter tundripaludum]EGW22060.1 hypothetical protein Mettu_0858 [Methylobacter tundripaludum SV96]